MFNLDESELDFDDEIFNLFPKKLKANDDISLNNGILSFGVENSIRSFAQCSNSSPPNILSHVNDDKNIKECKEQFKKHIKLSSETQRISSKFELIQSPSYSPITSTQINNTISTGYLFDKTNSISPVKFKPGFLSNFRKSYDISSSKKNLKSRKFPGPAGDLPTIDPNKGFINICQSNNQEAGSYDLCRKSISNTEHTFYSSSQQSDSNIWKCAKSNIGFLCWPFFEKYCLRNVLNMITLPNGLPNFKIPIICLYLVEIEYLPRDASGTMSDDTGSIKVALHRPVLQKYKDKIKVGSVFVLKKVSLFSPTGKKFFLNVTQSNVVDIFSEGDLEEDGEPRKTILTSDSINALIAECSYAIEMELNPQPIKINHANTDEFDDDMDQELISMMDESFSP